MHAVKVRTRARDLYAAGRSRAEIARLLGVSWRTVHTWCHHMLPTDDSGRLAGRCFRCRSAAELPDEPRQYAYLLGQYLGDGHLVTSAKVPVLRVTCALSYPGIIDECRQAMLATLARAVSIVPKVGCVNVQSYSTHWPCLLPQHGPGPKHHRPIVLVSWQQEVVDAFPRPFLRGLIHSDGCRVINRVRVRGRDYAYPRYHFANESTDILALCGDALGRVGAEWRFNRRNSISVAKKDSVALLDSFIGVKG
jgi:hypothetical protein